MLFPLSYLIHIGRKNIGAAKVTRHTSSASEACTCRRRGSGCAERGIYPGRNRSGAGATIEVFPHDAGYSGNSRRG